MDSDPLTYFSSLSPRARKSKLLKVSVVFESGKPLAAGSSLGTKEGRAAEPLVRGILTLLQGRRMQ